MTVLASEPIGRKNFIRRYFERTAETKLPKRFKRLIYISSILGVIKQIKEPDEVLINKLNSIFNIARYSDAIIFPMYIKSFIWSDVLTTNVIEVNGKKLLIADIANVNRDTYTDEECKTIATYFSKLSPSWLRYGSERLMVHDVTTLIQHLQEFNVQNEQTLAMA